MDVTGTGVHAFLRTFSYRQAEETATFPSPDAIFLDNASGSVRAHRMGMHVVLSDDLETLKQHVIGCGIAVHRAFGPGLLESIYQDCLAIELRVAGLTVEREHPVAIKYRDQTVRSSLKLDLVVDRRLIVEVKIRRTASPRLLRAGDDVSEADGIRSRLVDELQHDNAAGPPEGPGTPGPSSRCRHKRRENRNVLLTS